MSQKRSIFKNIELYKPKHLSAWRKLATAQWSPPRSSQVYAQVCFNLHKTLPYLEKINQQSQDKITINHLFAKACALTLKQFPHLNGRIIGPSIYFRKHIDIFMQVHLENKKYELAGLIIRNADTLSLTQIASITKQEAYDLRNNVKNPQHQAQNIFFRTPQWLMPLIVFLLDFFQNVCNLNLSFLKIPKDPFGSMMITAIGSLGIDEGFPPLVPISRVPALLAIGKIYWDWPRHLKNEAHITFADRVEHVKVGVVFDHRFMDGALGARMLKMLTQIIEDPETFFNQTE